MGKKTLHYAVNNGGSCPSYKPTCHSSPEGRFQLSRQTDIQVSHAQASTDDGSSPGRDLQQKGKNNQRCNFTAGITLQPGSTTQAATGCGLHGCLPSATTERPM